MLRSKTLFAWIALSLVGCAESTPVQDGGSLHAFGSDLPRFAVLSTDDTYTSTSVGFLDAEASPMVESWIHSGTVAPKLVETLGGDVVFVTEERGDGTFTLVDRFGTDVITRFDLATGEVIGQVRVRESFAVNPYDVAYTDDGRAFLVRFGKNPDPAASDLEAGNDIVELDPDTVSLVGLDPETGTIAGRIDLSPIDALVGDTMTYASPASALDVSGYLVVGLGRFALDYSAAAEGGFAIVEPASGNVELVKIPGLKSCEQVHRVPGHPARFAVHCGGMYGSEEPDAGLVVFELDADGQATEVASYLAEEGGSPLDSVVVLDGDRFFGIRFGTWDSSADPDVGYVVRFDDGEAEEVLRASAGGATLGTAAFDPETGILLVPDKNDGVIQLRAQGASFEEVRRFAFGRSGMRVRAFVRL